jgi:hypothetical protein
LHLTGSFTYSKASFASSEISPVALAPSIMNVNKRSLRDLHY